MAGPRSLDRHVDGDAELVLDSRQLPLLISFWSGAPSLELADRYAQWFAEQVESSGLRASPFVILDDASGAARPIPQVRGRLATITCPPETVLARVIVATTPAIKGAVTALTWITGRPLLTVATLERGLDACLQVLDEHGVAPPRELGRGPDR